MTRCYRHPLGLAEAAGDAAFSLVEAASTIMTIGGTIWVWVERRAPRTSGARRRAPPPILGTFLVLSQL